jgi:hypothetical protein
MKAWKGEPVAERAKWERWVEEKNVRADVKESLLN